MKNGYRKSTIRDSDGVYNTFIEYEIDGEIKKIITDGATAEIAEARALCRLLEAEI